MSKNFDAFPTAAGQRSQICRSLCLALLATGYASAQIAINHPAIGGRQHEPAHKRDQAVELSMKIKQPFTAVMVGDMLQMVPFSKNNDPDIQFLMNLMRGADMTTANNENTVMNLDTFTGKISHMMSPMQVADDWANMGIKIMTKANNHTWDDGEDGVAEDFRQLERVGIIHVGVGRNTTEARVARYAATPKGTVGFVGVYAESSQLMAAPTGRVVKVTPEQLAQLAAMRASIVARAKEVANPIDPLPDPEGTVSVYGIKFVTVSAAQEEPPAVLTRSAAPRTAQSNTVKLTTYNGVTAAQMAQLRAIAGSDGASSGDTLSAFGVKFRVTPGPGEYTYEMDQQDERDILREIRTGKQFSDFEIATIHWHQNRFAFQQYSFDHYPADYQIKFAHDAIDQGADVFYAHGVHTLKGVEIYKGRPIFYGVSNFVVQEQIFASWRDTGAEPPTPLTGPIVGQGEANEIQWEWMEQPANFETLLASVHYENGKLTEVRIYPVDLGFSRPGSQVGIPKRPSPQVAKRILDEVVELSKPFSTKISIENGVGVIHIAATN